LGVGKVVNRQSMGGSGWSSPAVLTTEDGQKFFAKESKGRGIEMFRGEAKGLQALSAAAEASTLRIPKVHHYSEMSGGAFLVMEFIEFGGRSSQEELGRGLAEMHLSPCQDPNAEDGKFGFEVDNTIGGTKQPNGWMDNWIDFYRERRLGNMLRLVNDSSLNKLGERLLPKLGKFFEGVQVRPSLLHGDIWSGNYSSVKGGGWSILDPAVYYGHHEADFGMSWCAGFSGDFWRGYRSVIPEDPGFADRRQLYMAYHFLNHEHLFGGYRGQAESALRHLANKL